MKYIAISGLKDAISLMEEQPGSAGRFSWRTRLDPHRCCKQDRPGVAPLLALFVVSTGVWLSLDQLGKGWAFGSWRVPARAVRIVPGFYAGAQARNYGGMYSLEGHRPPFLQGVLAVAGFVVLSMVFRWVFVLDRDRWSWFDAAAGGLLLAGALGNQVDRVILGYVRDYLIVASRPTDIFNTADVFMIVGAALLLGSLLIAHQVRDEKLRS